MEKVRYVINVVIVGLLLLTVAINRNAKVAGTPVDELFHSQEVTLPLPVRQLADGSTVVSSKGIVKGISGYGGGTPLEIYLKEGKITKVEALQNSESPDFWETMLQTRLLEQWNGLTPEEALALQVDAVSGATLSSEAVIATLRRTLEHSAQIAPQSDGKLWSLKTIIGLCVILLGICISLFAKSKLWRMIQQLLNVVVLGFWCGSFLSLSLLVNWLSNGVNFAVAIIPFALLLSAIILPLFGKKGHYCAWHCPLGSLQELAGKCNKRKLSIPERVLKPLNYLRETILLILLFTMWLGVGFSIMDYELFSAFLYNSANTVVILVALLFVILSLFIQRPYCRFICPTGALLKFTSNTKNR